MARKTVDARMVVLSIIIVMVLFAGSIAVSVGFVDEPGDSKGTKTIWNGIEVITPSDEPHENDNQMIDMLILSGLIDEKERYRPVLEIFKELSDLEGKEEFTNVYPSYYYYWGYDSRDFACDESAAGFGWGMKEASGVKVPTETPTVTSPEVPIPPEAEREVEEADIVKIVDDRMYVLNPYRGLQVIDLSDPDNPVILGRAPVLGTPVDLYVVGTRAIVITSATMNFWYQYIQAEYSSWRGEDDVSFRMGSEIAIIDVSDPTHPAVMRELGVDGFVTDSRRVGDVLYFVSSVSSFYNRTSESVDGDYTTVISIDLADPMNVVLVDEVKFTGDSNHIHVTKDRIYVTQTVGSDNSDNDIRTDITIVDISDPGGDIRVCDTFSVDGQVEERYQLDQYEGTFRIITHEGLSSVLWIFDVRDIYWVTQLSEMVIDDTGDLMATRFAGDRAYTIHLPRRSVDPLDVMDLSDPSNPELCCVLEIPGWVDHLIVRGYQILAIGVNQTWNQQVAITMFDVTDPYNAIVQDRVVLVGQRTWSQANWDPRSITVLDEDGLLLIPYASNNYDYQEQYGNENGVYVIKFDLEAGDLDLAGSYPHTGSVTRTRLLGDRVISTSIKFLEVADLTDPYDPQVTATLELCPHVLDTHVTGECIVGLMLRQADHGVSLRVTSMEQNDGVPPCSNLDLDIVPFNWIWNGHYLYLYSNGATDKTRKVNITTVDLSDPLEPRVVDRLTFKVEEREYEAISYSTYGPGYDLDYEYYEYERYPYYYGNDEYENLILLDEQLMVYENGERFYCFDLTMPSSPRIASILSIGETDEGNFNNVMTVGRTLMVTYSEFPDMDTQDYRVTPIRYMLRRVDLTDPSEPVFLPVVSIPGIPEGTDSSGRFLYTTGNWLFSDGEVRRTLNVAFLSRRECTLISSYDITSYDTVLVEGDLAVITEWDDESTQVFVLDLFVKGEIEPVWNVSLDGYLASPVVEDGHMFISGMDSSGMMIYSLEDPEVREVGFFPLDQTIESIRVAGDTAYVAQGMFGMRVLDLS